MQKIVFYLFLPMTNFCNSQEFYSINDTIYSKKELQKLMVKKVQKSVYKKFKCHFMADKVVTKNDSVIKFGTFAFLPKEFVLDKIYNLLTTALPEFKLEKQRGGYISSNELKGKPTIINLWFTKCPPCIEEIPVLNNIKEKYKERLNTLAITFNDRSEILDFKKKNVFEFEILINSRNYITEIGNKSYPKIILLDKNNIIRYIPFGIIARDEKAQEYLIKDLTEKIDLLLNE